MFIYRVSLVQKALPRKQYLACYFYQFLDRFTSYGDAHLIEPLIFYSPPREITKIWFLRFEKFEIFRSSDLDVFFNLLANKFRCR